MSSPDINVQQPTPPQPPSQAQSIDEWVQNLPQIYQTQLEYEPQLMQQQLGMQGQYAKNLMQQYMDLQQQYAPQMLEQQMQMQMEYAPQMAELQQQIQQDLYPETAGLQENLAAQAREGMESGVPDWMREQYRSNLSAQLGTNVGSGIGADYVSRGLLEQQQNWQNYYRNLALTAAGRQPLAQPGTVQTPQVSPAQYSGSQWTQGYTPQTSMGYNMQGYAPYAGAYSSMYNTNANVGIAQAQMPSPFMQFTQGAGNLGQAYGGYLEGNAAIMGMMSSKRYKENIKLWVKR